MESNIPIQYMHSEPPLSLLNILSNTLILSQIAPYIPVSSLLALGVTSKTFKDLVHNTPNVFRYLDLTRVKFSQSEIGSIDHGGEIWRNVQLDENVTEDDFYGGPLRGIFRALRLRHMLQDVQTMILDGLTIPVDLVAEIITQDIFNVRILSIRDVQLLHERRLQQALLHAIKHSNLRLQGLYIFGPKDSPHISPADIVPINRISLHGRAAGLEGPPRAEWKKYEETLGPDKLRNSDEWFEKRGKIFPKLISLEWASTMQVCQGIISFDAVLCDGPRHLTRTESSGPTTWYMQPNFHVAPQVATHVLGGCSGCSSSPEGFSRFGISPIHRFPLLAPPPLHSSTSKAAKIPPQGFRDKKLLVRCIQCLRGRYCETCHKWWCEDCYEVASLGYRIADKPQFLESFGDGNPERLRKNRKFGVIRSCFECGFNCEECVNRTQLMCNVCGGGYCLVHNEGSTLSTAGRHAINGCRC